MDSVRQALDTSERNSSDTMAQHRSTQRKVPERCADDAQLTNGIIELARGNYACDPHVQPGVISTMSPTNMTPRIRLSAKSPMITRQPPSTAVRR